MDQIDDLNFTFVEDGRPSVQAYQKTSRFRPGDKVIYRVPGSGVQEGPYLIASVPSTGKYVLAHQDGRKARNGAQVEEKHLKMAA
ncbi:hypothetical protein CLAIMM_06042 [Cladophialophora immunda]|nr:hypothetical protein CLAIMM_06042 [Cladophialophora immunda]